MKLHAYQPAGCGEGVTIGSLGDGKVVHGSRAVIAAAHPLAAIAGWNVLHEGGNAVDAAVAAAAVEWVVLPHLCGPGGDAFALVLAPGLKQPVALLGSGVAPDGAAADPRSQLPLEGVRSAAVPGAVAALGELWSRWGTMPWSRLLEPAVDLAERGFTVSALLSRDLSLAADKVSRHPRTARTYLPGGSAPAPGQILRQPELGTTLRRLAAAGPDDFYRGELAADILAAIAAAGGLFSGDEWREHATEIAEPLTISYRGHQLFVPPPPSQAFLALQCLKIAEAWPLSQWQPLSGTAVHHLVEAKKLAYADRLAYVGDPRCIDFDVTRLLSDQYAHERRSALNPQLALDQVAPGTPPELDDHTSFLGAADLNGYAVAWIHSVSGRTFGSAWIAGDTGIILNNRAGRGFVADPNHPNGIAYRKRTMHTLGAWMVLRDGEPLWLGGTPGGDQQPQWNLQVLVQLLDGGADPATAVSAPRWRSVPGTDPATVGEAFRLVLEAGFPEDTYRELTAKGHRLQQVGRWSGGGGVQVIGWQPGPTLIAAGDPRIDSLALGW